MGVNQVGVRTLKSRRDPRGQPADRRAGAYVVEDGFRGVQKSSGAAWHVLHQPVRGNDYAGRGPQPPR